MSALDVLITHLIGDDGVCLLCGVATPMDAAGEVGNSGPMWVRLDALVYSNAMDVQPCFASTGNDRSSDA